MRGRFFIPFSFLFLVATESFCAGLDRYAGFVVADTSRKTSPEGGVQITYLGTNGYAFEFKRHVLLVDPYFSRMGMWQTLFASRIHPDEERIDFAMRHLPSNADAILVTHGHVDHLLDVSAVMRKTDARLIASRTAVELANAAGAPAARLDRVRAGDVRQIGPWKIHVLAAQHDRFFPIGVPFSGDRVRSGPPQRASHWVCGEPLAFLIEANGKRIYIDSGGRPSLLPPADLGPVDLAILGVALPDSRARFVDTTRRLRPHYILPSHQDNFFQPLDRGFVFGSMTDFPRVLRDYQRARLPGRLILLDYFRPWTLQ